MPRDRKPPKEPPTERKLEMDMAVVEAYGSLDATDDVAMKMGEEKDTVPVAVSWLEPFKVSGKEERFPAAVKSSPIVPALVIVPPVRPLLVATDVTVPRLAVIHTLLTA